MVEDVQEVKKRNTKEYHTEYYQSHKDEIKEYFTEYYQKNKDKINAKSVEYRKNHKAELKLKNAKRYQNHKDEIKEYFTEYYQKNKDKIKIRTAKRYQNHKAELKVKNAEYYQKNKTERKEYFTEYYQKINPKYRNRKVELIQATSNKCQKDNCGIEYDGTNGAIFQFHHIDRKSKSFQLSDNLITSIWDELINEAKKCKLLCANCHSLEHTVDKPKTLKTIKERDIKTKLIQLKGNKCQGDNCNIVFDGTNMASFQFHHIDRKTKLFNLSNSNLSTHTWNELLDETSKCKLLCANCHAKIHSGKY